MRTGSPTAMLPEESARHTEPARLRSAVRAPVLGAVVAVTDDAKAGFDVHGLDGTHGEPAGRGDVDGRDHRRLFAAGGLVAAHDSAWSRQSDAEFMQYRSPVAVDPSGNTWRGWASQAAQRASVRTMPWLGSSVTRASVISRSKLGQPVPVSNLASLSNSSVLASWVTWQCSGVTRLRISSSDGRRSVGFVTRVSPLENAAGRVERVPEQLVRVAVEAIDEDGAVG